MKQSKGKSKGGKNSRPYNSLKSYVTVYGSCYDSCLVEEQFYDNGNQHRCVQKQPQAKLVKAFVVYIAV